MRNALWSVRSQVLSCCFCICISSAIIRRLPIIWTDFLISHLESRYLTQVPLTIWLFIILFLQTILHFLIQPIYTLLMIHLLQSLSLVILLPLLIRQVDSPCLLSFAFLNLPWNYYLLANLPIIITTSYLHPLLILFKITTNNWDMT